LLIDAGSDVNYVGRRGTLLDVIDQQVQWSQRDIADPKLNDGLRDAAKLRLAKLQEHIEQLTSHGAKRKAEMTPAELGAANPPTEKKDASAKPARGEAKPKLPPLGAAHFLKLTNRGEPEWSLLAVEAPLDQVTDALSQRHKSAVQPSVEIKKS